MCSASAEPTPSTITTSSHTSNHGKELDLDKVTLLRGLDSSTRSKLVASLQSHDYHPGDVVFEQGSTGQSLYFLEQGVVEVVVDREYVVDDIQEGSVFGEIALLLSMPRTATIRAATECVAYELQRPAFEAAAMSSPILKDRLEAIKEQRWSRFRKDLEAAVLQPDKLEPKQKAYLMEVFKQIDADGSGAIDEEELAIMLERLAGHAFPPSHVEAMMQTLDSDGNGTIEADEFLEGLPLLAQWLLDNESSSSSNTLEGEPNQNQYNSNPDKTSTVKETRVSIRHLKERIRGFLHRSYFLLVQMSEQFQRLFEHKRNCQK